MLQKNKKENTLFQKILSKYKKKNNLKKKNFKQSNDSFKKRYR